MSPGFYGQFWSRGFDFSGRTRRRDYCLSLLINSCIGIFAGICDAIIDVPVLTGLVFLVFLIPSIAISVRRLHDIGKSGLWLLLSCIPIAGIIVIVFFFFESQKGDNIYGTDPKGRVPIEVPIGTVSYTQD